MMEIGSLLTAVYLFVAGVTMTCVADGEVPDLRSVRAFDQSDFSGPFRDFYDNCPDLSEVSMDNMISSVCVTGVWSSFKNVSYEDPYGGLRGFNHCLPVFSEELSSLRYAGSPYGLNDEYYNLYEEMHFAGAEFKGNTNAGSLGALDGDVSALIITGQSPWTFFTGLDYTGLAVCVYPNIRYESDSGMVLDSYWANELPYHLDLPDNSIRSVARGCLSTRVVGRPSPAAPDADGGHPADIVH